MDQLSIFGGTDISKLFGDRLKNKLEMFELKSYTEHGQLNGLFWWNDPVYVIGSITTRERHICVRNKAESKLLHLIWTRRFMCTVKLNSQNFDFIHKGTQYHLAVCEEDSIYVIQAKCCATYPEIESDRMIWRKTESTVRFVQLVFSILFGSQDS